MPQAAAEAEGLVKTYAGRTGTVEAVRGVDLRLEAGEIFGFLGPNGAGKSTTVRMLDLGWETIGLGFLVVVVAGAVTLALSVRVMRNYD